MSAYREFSSVLSLCVVTDLHKLIWDFLWDTFHSVRAKYCFSLNLWWKLSYTPDYVHLNRVKRQLILTKQEPLKYIVHPDKFEPLEDETLSFSYYTFCVKIEKKDIYYLHRKPFNVSCDNMKYDHSILQDREREKEIIRNVRAQLRALVENFNGGKEKQENENSSSDSDN